MLHGMEDTKLAPTTLPFTVLYWGSHPDAGNDDCYSGSDYASLAEALHAYNDDELITDSSVAFVELDGPGITGESVRPSPFYRPEPSDDGEWRREQAMEAGMLGGCDAYNDAMGWG